jgi:hypothetical protein
VHRCGHPRILFGHILPNAISPIIVRATIGMGFTILVAAVLGFLGMGATPPDPDWGLAIAESRQYLPEAWWFSTFPGLAIFLTVLGFNLLGDGLRDIVDPACGGRDEWRRAAARQNLRLSVRGDEGTAQILDHVELALARGKVLGVVG